jgi:cytochrome bd ubiquinol oxidase subunit I
MGLALLLVYLKTKALRTGDEHYNRAAGFLGRIFGINFAVGVITGIPMEFQFGTNWAAFSKAAGGVIGQTLAMEGGSLRRQDFGNQEHAAGIGSASGGCKEGEI